MPGDELLVATGYAAAGGRPDRLAIYFVGLCHLALNPTVAVIRGGSAEMVGFIGEQRCGLKREPAVSERPPAEVEDHY